MQLLHMQPFFGLHIVVLLKKIYYNKKNSLGNMMLMLLYFSIAIGISFLCSILEAVILSINQSHIELIKQEKPKLGSLMYKQKKD